MKREYGYCRNCSNKSIIVNKRHYLCQDCNWKRLHPGEEVRKYPLTPKECYPPPKKKRYSETFPYDMRWGFKTEREMFEWISKNREPVSFFSGDKIDFRAFNFLHVLPKAINQYPHFRLNPDNIVLGTLDEHHTIDFGDEEKKKALPNYRAFEVKRLQLIAEYIKLFGDPKKQIQKDYDQ